MSIRDDVDEVGQGDSALIHVSRRVTDKVAGTV